MANVEVSTNNQATWNPTNSMMATRSGFDAVYHRGFIYAGGGYSDGGALSSVEFATATADGNLGMWIGTTPFTTPRFGEGLEVIGNNLCAIGGMTNAGASLISVECLLINPDGTLQAPRKAFRASLTNGRAFFGHTTTNELVYVLGGIDGGGNALASAEVYDPTKDT